MLETLSPLNITSFGNTSSIKSSLLYTRKENALLFRVSQTCSESFLAMLSHVIHCHFYFLVLTQSEIFYISRQNLNTSCCLWFLSVVRTSLSSITSFLQSFLTPVIQTLTPSSSSPLPQKINFPFFYNFKKTV